MHAAIKLRSNRPVAAPTILRTAVPSSAIRGNIERESWGPRVDYQAILGDTRKAEMGQIVAYLREELPYFWREEYVLMTPRKTNIVLMEHGTFTYQYDFYSQLEVFGIVHANGHIEDRLVAGLGMSAPAALRREGARMRGWIGPLKNSWAPTATKVTYSPVPSADSWTAWRSTCSRRREASTEDGRCKARCTGRWNSTALPTPTRSASAV